MTNEMSRRESAELDSHVNAGGRALTPPNAQELPNGDPADRREENNRFPAENLTEFADRLPVASQQHPHNGDRNPKMAETDIESIKGDMTALLRSMGTITDSYISLMEDVSELKRSVSGLLPFTAPPPPNSSRICRLSLRLQASFLRGWTVQRQC